MEVPICRRSCFCVPLRYRLLTWAYISLFANFFLLTTYGFDFAFFFRHPVFYDAFLNLSLVIGFLNTVAVSVLTFLLVISLHKKSMKWLKLYYKSIVVYFAVAVLLMVTGLAHILLVHWKYSMWSYFAGDIIIRGLSLGIQHHIIALVKSEIMKLTNNTNFEFSNIPVEAEGSFYGLNVQSDKPKNATDNIGEGIDTPNAEEKTVEEANEDTIAERNTEKK